MRAPFKENTAAARRERVERAERALIEAFRTLSDFLRRAADTIERRRLERAGYDEQGRFLERVRDGRER